MHDTKSDVMNNSSFKALWFTFKILVYTYKLEGTNYLISYTYN